MSKDYDSNNIFAKILRGEIPSYKIFETVHVLAIFDLFPMSKGHALLLTKGNYSRITDMPSSEAGAFLSELPRLAKAVKSAFKADGINIAANEEKCAGQEIPHVHFHIIPTYASDKKRNVSFEKSGPKLEEQDANDQILAVKTALGLVKPGEKVEPEVELVESDLPVVLV